MGKRIIALFLIMLHFNGFMLLPQIYESDVYCNGHQVDDINTVAEYIQQEILDFADETPEDEDDDRPQDLEQLGIKDELYAQQICSNLIVGPIIESAISFFHYSSEKPFTLSYDIPLPPPKA